MMNSEEWKAYTDEYFNLDEEDLLDMDDDDTSGNPYGAGRYGYIRSSKNYKALIRGKGAEFDSEHNRWFEHISCGYASWRDGDANQEYDDLYREQLEKKRPLISYREAFYNYEYGDTREEVANIFIFLTEYVKGNRRSFHFDLDDITMQEAQEYITALANWSHTGELNIGPYRGIPSYTAWRAK